MNSIIHLNTTPPFIFSFFNEKGFQKTDRDVYVKIGDSGYIQIDSLGYRNDIDNMGSSYETYQFDGPNNTRYYFNIDQKPDSNNTYTNKANKTIQFYYVMHQPVKSLLNKIKNIFGKGGKRRTKRTKKNSHKSRRANKNRNIRSRTRK